MSSNSIDRATAEELVGDFVEDLARRNASETAVRGYRRAAEHFMVWADAVGAELAGADDALLQRFGRHRHKCASFKHCNVPAQSPREVAGGAVAFVRFLEERGLVRHSGELTKGMRMVEKFKDSVLAQGCRQITAEAYRQPATHFVIWLHQSRIPLCDVDESVIERFAEHDCLCLGVSWRRRTSQVLSPWTMRKVALFADFLSGRDIVAGQPPRKVGRKNVRLEPFAQWLLRHRGVSESTVRVYLRNVGNLLGDVGYDSKSYDAALIRDAMLKRFECSSTSESHSLTTATRAYLRFLASTGECGAGLLGAVPTAPSWKLATIPRYLPEDVIERAIGSCDLSQPVGIRDRAILLLLARLGLRAGDVSDLRLGDIDWQRARITVAGKSKYAWGLPLPQDVGDAVLEYIERVRPRVQEEKVFLRIPAPPRPLKNGGSVSEVAARALLRVGVSASRPHGAHVFRHSVATTLLRSGASLDVVGALLRHRSANTTAIYAKVDVPMLQEVAQPWIGELR